MFPCIKNIEKKIASSEVIPESELLIYVHVKCQMRTQREVRCNAKNKKPFTVIWFDEFEKTSHMIKVCAENSIEALDMARGEYPLFSGVTAYPLHLPETLRFVPDESYPPFY